MMVHRAVFALGALIGPVRARYLLEEAARRCHVENMPQNAISLYGQLYDITHIATWHPGGANILKQAAALCLADATPLFESQHSLRDPDEMFGKLAPYALSCLRV